MIERVVDKIRVLHTLFMKYQFARFFIVGSSGVVLNLGVTWALTTFFFGLPHYFIAYLCGIAANMAFNFTLYSLTIFNTKTNHARRLVVFVLYSIAMSTVQASVVRAVTPFVGLHFYLLVIATTILLFATINFFVFKLSLFRED